MAAKARFAAQRKSAKSFAALFGASPLTSEAIACFAASASPTAKENNEAAKLLYTEGLEDLPDFAIKQTISIIEVLYSKGRQHPGMTNLLRKQRTKAGSNIRCSREEATDKRFPIEFKTKRLIIK